MVFSAVCLTGCAVSPGVQDSLENTPPHSAPILSSTGIQEYTVIGADPDNKWIEVQKHAFLEHPEWQEIYALQSVAGCVVGIIEEYVITFDGSRAVLYLPTDSLSYSYRPLTPSEWGGFRSFIQNNDVLDLADCRNSSKWSGADSHQFLCLNRSFGKYFVLENPTGWNTCPRHNELRKWFTDLAESGEFEQYIPWEKYARGLKPVFLDENLSAEAVREHNGKIYVLFSRDEGEPESFWCSLNGNNELGPERGDFPDYPYIHAFDDMDAYDTSLVSHLNKYPWQVRSGDCLIRNLRIDGRPGLFKCREGQPPEPIEYGWFSEICVSPDGRWLLAARTDTDWADPNYVLRIRLSDNKAFKLDLPDHDYYFPLTYLDYQGKFLVYHDTSMYLVDPVTGGLEEVSGDVWPVTGWLPWPLQSAGKPYQYWAAADLEDEFDDEAEEDESGDGEEDEEDIDFVTIGIFDARTLTFTKYLGVRGFWFDSDSMWVDTENDRILFVDTGVFEIDLTQYDFWAELKRSLN